MQKKHLICQSTGIMQSPGVTKCPATNKYSVKEVIFLKTAMSYNWAIFEAK